MILFTSNLATTKIFWPQNVELQNVGFSHLLDTIYRPRGETFVVFMVFHSTVNVFLWIMALSISNISLQKCYSESFTANSYFPLKTQNFSPVDIFLYTVLSKYSNYDLIKCIHTHFAWPIAIKYSFLHPCITNYIQLYCTPTHLLAWR